MRTIPTTTPRQIIDHQGGGGYVKHLSATDRYSVVIVFVALGVIEFSAYFGASVDRHTGCGWVTGYERGSTAHILFIRHVCFSLAELTLGIGASVEHAQTAFTHLVLLWQFRQVATVLINHL